ncbi:MAG: histidine kinase [Pseudomonadota bacterium]|nr:histidine kinase [Pseudomonadota bacterium]
MAVVPATASIAEADRGLLALAAPQRMLFGLWAVFWLIMILVATQDELGSGDIGWWEPLLWEGSSCAGATAWLLWQRRHKQRFAPHLDQPLQWFGRQLLWLPLLAATFITFVYSLRHAVYALVGDTYQHEPWPFIVVYESLKLLLYSGLWLGIIFGFDAFEQWQAQRRRLLELQKSLAEAQLSQLKAQLRPHFLFNALNTISALMHVDVERADRLLARLGDLLRASLRISDQEMTALREELRTLELFAQIMQERFADRVVLAWNVAPSLLDTTVPVLLLQPLLENAFKHGVERSIGSVSIDVSAGAVGDSIVLEVRNTGSALPPEYRDGVGLRNCRERLKVIYGDAASVQLIGAADAVIARVTLPRQAWAA